MEFLKKFLIFILLVRETVPHVFPLFNYIIMSVQKTLKTKVIQKLTEYAHSYEVSITEIEIGEMLEAFYNIETKELEIVFDGYVIFDDEPEVKETNILSLQITCGFRTPKGYLSSKKIPVVIEDTNNLSLLEIESILEYETSAIKNTFDPFYHENLAKWKNACGWAGVVKYLQADCR